MEHISPNQKSSSDNEVLEIVKEKIIKLQLDFELILEVIKNLADLQRPVDEFSQRLNTIKSRIEEINLQIDALLKTIN